MNGVKQTATKKLEFKKTILTEEMVKEPMLRVRAGELNKMENNMLNQI